MWRSGSPSTVLSWPARATTIGDRPGANSVAQKIDRRYRRPVTDALHLIHVLGYPDQLVEVEAVAAVRGAA
jgi:hypothetical protein